MTSTRDVLFIAMCEDVKNPLPKLALADLYEEEGSPLAELWRYLGENNKYPNNWKRLKQSKTTNHSYWWYFESYGNNSHDPQPTHAVLPDHWLTIELITCTSVESSFENLEKSFLKTKAMAPSKGRFHERH